MTSLIEDNRCKLLLLDLDTNNISIDGLHTYFISHGAIEWIEIYPKSSSAVIQFTSSLIVDHLVNTRKCLFEHKQIRLRRFRSDSTNYQSDSYTLHVKLPATSHSKDLLTETSLRQCFHKYESYISNLDMLCDNQALISFRNYDYVDQILLMSSAMFLINGETPVFERIMTKIHRKSRWDQQSQPLTTVPILSVRNPLLHKLISHIEYLTKQLREQPAHCRNEIERLEAEVFILKNENALFKSKEKALAKATMPQRSLALADISNRHENKPSQHRRERSRTHEKQIKRRRVCQNSDDYAIPL